MKTFSNFFEEIKPPEPQEEDPSIKSKEKRQMQIKKQVLLKKMQAVRAGAGADIVASHTPDGKLVEGKKKGLDGKACWDGYKLSGTKKKGGKTVDNCVKEEDKAFNFVLNKIKKEVGKSGYVSKDNPRKPQTDAEKAKVRAHKAKLAKQDHRDPTEKASDGRYSDKYSNRGSD